MTPKPGDLSHLVEPMGLDLFLNEFWEKQSAYIQGHRRKFEGLFNRSAWQEGIRACSQLKVGIYASDHQGSYTEFDITADQAEEFLRAGGTVCAIDLQRADRKLANLIRHVKDEMGYAGGMRLNSYASLDEQGFPLHFDQHSVFILQIEGSKRWRFSREAAVPCPAHNVIFEMMPRRSTLQGDPVRLPAEMEMDEALLAPGDVLYLPAGAWHQGKAEGFSLALTLQMTGLRMLDLLLTQLGDVLRRRPEWRAKLPAAPLSVPGEIPAEVGRELAARTEDLKALVAGLDWTWLRRAWFRAAITPPDDPGSSDAPRQRPPADLEPDTVLRTLKGTPLRFLVEPGEAGVGRIFLYSARGEIVMPGEALAFVRGLASGRPFTGGQALQWGEDSEWEDVRGLLEQLEASGVLERAENLEV